MMDAKQRLNLRLNIYFALTNKQQRMVNSLVTANTLEELELHEFKAITRDKKLREQFKQLKYSTGLRLVVDNGLCIRRERQWVEDDCRLKLVG